MKNGTVNALHNCPMMTQASPKGTLPLTLAVKTSPVFMVVGMDRKMASAYLASSGMPRRTISQLTWFESTTMASTVSTSHSVLSKALLIELMSSPKPWPRKITAIRMLGDYGALFYRLSPNCGIVSARTVKTSREITWKFFDMNPKRLLHDC